MMGSGGASTVLLLPFVFTFARFAPNVLSFFGNDVERKGEIAGFCDGVSIGRSGMESGELFKTPALGLSNRL